MLPVGASTRHCSKWSRARTSASFFQNIQRQFAQVICRAAAHLSTWRSFFLSDLLFYFSGLRTLDLGNTIAKKISDFSPIPRANRRKLETWFRSAQSVALGHMGRRAPGVSFTNTEVFPSVDMSSKFILFSNYILIDIHNLMYFN